MPIARLGSILAATASLSTAAQIHVFVDDDAPDGGDGLSWNTALNDLREAVRLAEVLGGARGEIRIAGGDYLGDLAEPLVIERYGGVISGMVLRGGFGGLMSPGNPDARDPTSGFVTTLRGLGGGPIIEVNSAPVLTGTRVLGSGPFRALRGTNLARGTVFESLTFLGDQAISVQAEPDAAVRITDCRFVGGSARDGGAVFARSVSLLIERSDFVDNTATWSGGALRHVDGDLIVQDCLFQDNSSNFFGGAINAGSVQTTQPNTGNVSVERTVFLENQSRIRSANGNGGAIAAGVSSLVISGSVFERCEGDLGGAVYSTSSMTKIDSSDFLQNEARLGGAVFAGRSFVSFPPYELHVERTDLIENQAEAGGGLFASSDVEVTVSDAVFRMNSATDGDGGAAAASVGGFRFIDFDRNDASERGGAIAGAVTVRDSDFSGNSADIGGAVWGATLLEDSTLVDNMAGTRGGAIADTSVLSRIDAIDNTSWVIGGGASLQIPFEIRDSRFLRNTVVSGFEQRGEQIDVSGASGSIERTTLTPLGNPAFSAGDLSVFDESFVSIRDSLIGGLTRVDSSIVDIRNCTIAAPVQPPSFAVSAENGGDVLIESSVIDASGSLGIGVGSSAVVVQSFFSNGAAGFANSAARVDVLGELYQGDPGFVDRAGPDNLPFTLEDNDYRPAPGSALIDRGFGVRPVDAPPIRLDLDGMPRVVDDIGLANQQVGPEPIDIGAVEFQGVSCVADVNGDGLLDSRDFTSWVLAYNNNASAADQNRDGIISPLDFSSWIANFNRGCGG
ncbi:MAG: GC-type dockerin domain-anchored protein [Planctomycetota bacterium]